MLFFSTHVHIFKRHITCTTRIGMKGSKISGKNAPQHSISTMQMEHTDRFIRRFGMAFLSKIRSQQEQEKRTQIKPVRYLVLGCIHISHQWHLRSIELRSRREHDAMSHNCPAAKLEANQPIATHFCTFERINCPFEAGGAIASSSS